jgi:hypothetical protein
MVVEANTRPERIMNDQILRNPRADPKTVDKPTRKALGMGREHATGVGVERLMGSNFGKYSEPKAVFVSPEFYGADERT